jgi:threonyl-tRNA synthetase
LYFAKLCLHFLKEGEEKSIEGQSWRTTPLQIAREAVSKGWAENIIIAKVDGVLWDLERVLESSCEVKFLKFEDSEGTVVVFDRLI